MFVNFANPYGRRGVTLRAPARTNTVKVKRTMGCRARGIIPTRGSTFTEQGKPKALPSRKLFRPWFSPYLNGIARTQGVAIRPFRRDGNLQGKYLPNPPNSCYSRTHDL